MTTSRPRVIVLALLAGGLLLAVAQRASAYERTQTCNSYGTYECDQNETPKPISWPVRCVKYRINEEGSDQFGSQNGQISTQLENLVVRAFQTWNDPSCSDFLMVNGGLTSNDRARYNEDKGIGGNTNVVVWRDEQWPYSQSRTAFALTSVTYDSKKGVISDADIEINSDTYEFAHLQESRVGDEEAKIDLLNTLTHEVGHFVGLDHPDDPKATMYGRAPPGETRKRSLAQDDIDGICAIYPVQGKRATCRFNEDFVPPDDGNDNSDDSSGICSIGSAASSRLPILVVWLAVLAGSWRRRSRRGHETRTDGR